jgi:hypothetical protein
VLKAKGIDATKISVKFEPLWTPSDEEDAKTRFYQAQTDEKYISNNVLLPEEVMLSRFKDKGKWSPDWTAADRPTRVKMLKDLLKELENGGPPEPQLIPVVPGQNPAVPVAPGQKPAAPVVPGQKPAVPAAAKPVVAPAKPKPPEKA